MTTDTTYTFVDEDHTIGVLLRANLLENPDVTFAAYKVPHPLTRSVEVRVQTTTDTTTDDAAHLALENISAQLDDFEKSFQASFEGNTIQ